MSQILVLVGVACLVVALAFGLAGQTVSVSAPSSGGTVSGSAPGPAAQGAACGFAIAGGLCLLGAAVAHAAAPFAALGSKELRQMEDQEVIYSQTQRIRELEGALSDSEERIRELEIASRHGEQGNEGAGPAEQGPGPQ